MPLASARACLLRPNLTANRTPADVAASGEGCVGAAGYLDR
jgi:hypothetical protein